MVLSDDRFTALEGILVGGRQFILGMRHQPTTHGIGWPRRSMKGSTPKSLRRENARLSRRGRGRFCCPNSANTAAEVRAFARGASSPK